MKIKNKEAEMMSKLVSQHCCCCANWEDVVCVFHTLDSYPQKSVCFFSVKFRP